MRVQHALGRPGTTAGEQGGCWVGRMGVGTGCLGIARLANTIKRRSSPEPAGAESDLVLDAAEGFAKYGGYRMRDWNGDDSLRCDLLDAFQDIFSSQSRVDENGNRSAFKQRE